MLRRSFGAPYKTLSINNIAIFRVIKIPTLKMVNSLLLSDLLVARRGIRTYAFRKYHKIANY